MFADCGGRKLSRVCQIARLSRRIEWLRSCLSLRSQLMFTPTALQTIDPATLASALFDGPERSVPKGARIFCPGDPGHNLFLLRRGLVKLSTMTPKGDEITLRVYRPADIFGEGCFSRPVHRYWATALERSEVVEASVARA